MNTGGDAAEQLVRLSLEGVEVVARITGDGAKNIAFLLAAVLREEHKTQGKARLSNMIKSGKELKVFSVQNKDLKKFSQEAKRYGVLYCVLKDKENTSEYATVDIIARAEDASKIQRIMDRFELATVDRATVVREVQKELEKKKEKQNPENQTSREERIVDDVLKKVEKVNPDLAETEKDPLSVPDLKHRNQREGTIKQEKSSVRKKLKEYRNAADREKAKTKQEVVRDANTQGKPNRKKKKRGKER